MIRRGLLLGVVLLYVLSIPWYRGAGGDAEPAVGILLGLPDWATVALACYLGAAVLNALAWLCTDVPDPSPEHGALAVCDPLREQDALPDREAPREPRGAGPS